MKVVIVAPVDLDRVFRLVRVDRIGVALGCPTLSWYRRRRTRRRARSLQGKSIADCLLEGELGRPVGSTRLLREGDDVLWCHNAVLAALDGPLEPRGWVGRLDTVAARQVAHEADDALGEALVAVSQRVASAHVAAQLDPLAV